MFPDTVTAQSMGEENAADAVPSYTETLTPSKVNDSTAYTGNTYPITRGGTYTLEGGTYSKGFKVETAEPVVFKVNGNITVDDSVYLFIYQTATDSSSAIGKVTFNGGNYTITGSYSLFHVESNTNTPGLHIIGGTYKSTGDNVVTIRSGALTMENCTVTVTGSFHYAVNGYTTGQITLNNCNFTADATAINQNKDNGRLTINGGTYTSKDAYALSISSGTVAEIHGGTFDCQKQQLASTGVFLGAGASLTVDGNALFKIAPNYNSKVITLSDNCTFTMNSGTIDPGTKNYGVYASGDNVKINLNGGTIRNGMTGVYIFKGNKTVTLGDNFTFSGNTLYDISFHDSADSLPLSLLKISDGFNCPITVSDSTEDSGDSIQEYRQITTTDTSADKVRLISFYHNLYTDVNPERSSSTDWAGYDKAGRYIFRTKAHDPLTCYSSEYSIQYEGQNLSSGNVKLPSGTTISDLNQLLTVSATGWKFRDYTFTQKDYGDFSLTYYKSSSAGIRDNLTTTSALQVGTYYARITNAGSGVCLAREALGNWKFEIVPAPASAGNYTVSASNGTDTKPLPAAGTTPAELPTFTYNGSPVTATGTRSNNNVGTVTGVKYAKVAPVTGEPDKNSTTSTAPTAPGTYQVYLTVAAQGSYGAGTVTDNAWRFTIAKATLTDADFNTGTLHDTGKTSLKDTLKGTNGINISYTYTYAGNEEGVTSPEAGEMPTIAGPYKVTFTTNANDNYNAFTSVEYKYVVPPRKLQGTDFTYAFSDHTFQYENPIAYPVTVTPKDSVKPVSDEITVHYYTNAERTNELDGVPTEPGKYWFDFDITATFNNEAAQKLCPKNNSFTIAKANLTEEQIAANITVTPPQPHDGKDELVYDSTGFAADAAKSADAVMGFGDTVTITGYAKLKDDGSVDESTFSAAAPTEPGTYAPQVTVSEGSRYLQGTRYVTAAKFTIQKAKLDAGDFNTIDLSNITADPIGKPGSDGVSVSKTFYVDTDGNQYDSLVNAPSGRYEIWVVPQDSNGRYAEDAIDTGRTRLVDQYQLDQRNFEFQCQPEYNYDGEGHGVDVTVKNNTPDPLKTISVGNGITVEYYNDDTGELVSTNEKPVAAGRYRYLVKVEETSNNFAFEYGPKSFIIKAHTPTEADFDYTAPTGLTTASTEDEIKEAIRKALTPKNGIDMADVEIILTDDAASEGEHSFTLNVRAAADGSYSAAEGLAKEAWKYTVAEAVFRIDISNAVLTDGEGNTITDCDHIKAGTAIHIKFDSTGLDEEFNFLGWEFAEAEGFTTPEGEVVLNSEEDSHFIMPNGNVKLVLVVPAPPAPTPEPGQSGSSGDGGAAAAIIGTAAVGSAAYLVGTQVYLEHIFGQVPANRQELALALWNKAGKPAPQSNVLFADISAEAADSQKAARWCVEQELLEADGEQFKPQRYVTRIRSIKAWNDAKEKGLIK